MAQAPTITFKTAYGPKLRVKLNCPEPGRTKQSHKAECDINNILSRYQKTGVLEFVNKHAAQYGDVSGIDFQNAVVLVAEQKQRFAELPSKVRNSFNNDPAEYLDFVASASSEELANAGLLERAEPAEDEPAQPVVEAEAPAKPA